MAFLKITTDVANKLGMVKGEWFKNACLWEIYKARPSAFDRCKDYAEVLEKGLIPTELLELDGNVEDEDCIDLDSF